MHWSARELPRRRRKTAFDSSGQSIRRTSSRGPASPVSRISSAIDKASRSRVKKIEIRVATIDTELGKLEAKLADPAIYNGSTAELMKLGQQQAELRREKETLEAEWLELYEQIEA